jgi:cytochrome c
MFDTTTFTKIAASVLGAWLVLLLGKWFAEELYHADSHGEASYVIEIETAEAEPEEEIDFGALLASADIDDGAKVFRKCSSCHKVADGENGVGPHLYGIVGRDVAAADGFNYSGSLIAVAQVWDTDALNGFLENPKSYAPGTTMGFSGLKKPEDRANLIAYLDSLDD